MPIPVDVELPGPSLYDKLFNLFPIVSPEGREKIKQQPLIAGERAGLQPNYAGWYADPIRGPIQGGRGNTVYWPGNPQNPTEAELRSLMHEMTHAGDWSWGQRPWSQSMLHTPSVVTDPLGMQLAARYNALAQQVGLPNRASWATPEEYVAEAAEAWRPGMQYSPTMQSMLRPVFGDFTERPAPLRQAYRPTGPNLYVPQTRSWLD